MSDDIIVSKPKVKKKKKDALDIFIKEYKNDRNDLRILIYLSTITGLDYKQIDLKKHELLKLLITDYANRKNAAKAKQIKTYIKSNFKQGNILSHSNEVVNFQTEDSIASDKELIMKDIKRAFGDPEDSTSLAYKLLEDIYNMPDLALNCNYNPDMLVEKLYEYYGKTKKTVIYYRAVPNMGQKGKGSSNWWNASLNPEISTKKIEMKR